MKRVVSVFMATAMLLVLALPVLAISGIVVNKEGKPVAGAKVEINLDYRTYETVTTDAKGQFSYTPPDGKDARCSILVTAPGYAYLSCIDDLTVLQKDPVKLVLWPEKKLKGKVVDENGKPVAGARIALENLNASAHSGYRLFLDGRQWKEGQVWSEGVVTEVTTGPDGTFTLDHFPDPSGLEFIYFMLEATAEGRALITQTIYETSLRGPLVITLPLECKLQGTVYMPDKSGPVTGGVWLAIPGTGGRATDGRTAAVGKDGKYSFEKLPPGSWKMILGSIKEQDYKTNQPTGAKKSWVFPAIPLELTAGKTQTVDVNLVEGLLIKGKVVDSASGSNVKTAELFIYHAGRPQDTAPLFLHRLKDGEFSCYVAPGEVDISPQSVGDGADKMSFYSEDTRPHLTFTATEPKEDLVFKIDPGMGKNYGILSAPKPVPADLELTAGTYNLEWDPEVDCSQNMRGKILSGDEARSKILKLPKLVSKKPLFYAVQFDGTIDDGYFVYAVDESQGTGYDTIYADLNRNRNLADDKPIKIDKPSNRRSARTPWIEVPSRQGQPGGVHLKKPVKISFSTYAYGGTVNVNMSRKGAWRGKIDTNKGKIDCIALDTNANGVYGDRTQIGDDLTLVSEKLGDCLFADINLSGTVSMLPAVQMTHQLWGQETTMVAGKLYTIKLSPAGDKITVADYSGQTGKLVASADKMKSLDASITSLSIIGKSGYFNLTEYSGEPVTLPAGKYQIGRCTVSLPQSTGSRIDFDCQPDLTVDIKPGQQAKAELGGEFVTRGIEPDKKVVYLHSDNSSKAGWSMELGDNITITRIDGTGNYNSYYPDAKLFDKSGKMVGASKARYT